MLSGFIWLKIGTWAIARMIMHKRPVQGEYETMLSSEKRTVHIVRFKSDEYSGNMFLFGIIRGNYAFLSQTTDVQDWDGVQFLAASKQVHKNQTHNAINEANLPCLV